MVLLAKAGVYPPASSVAYCTISMCKQTSQQRQTTHFQNPIHNCAVNCFSTDYCCGVDLEVAMLCGNTRRPCQVSAEIPSLSCISKLKGVTCTKSRHESLLLQKVTMSLALQIHSFTHNVLHGFTVAVTAVSNVSDIQNQSDSKQKITFWKTFAKRMLAWWMYVFTDKVFSLGLKNVK